MTGTFYTGEKSPTMRSCTPLLLAAALGLPAAGADEGAAQLAAQKKKAQANWDAVEAGPAATLETKHLLLYAPKSMEKRLKAAGPLLEKHYELASAALSFDPKEGPWPGKLAVYLFPEREQFGAFVRRVEKKRLLPEQATAFAVESDDDLHGAAQPSKARGGLPLEGQAGAAVAQALLARKAGKDTPLPGWLMAGFGRATYHRAAPADKAVLADRRQARALSRTRGPADAWDDKLDADEAEALRGSLADFLAYGPGAPKFAAFVTAFKPGEDMQAKTTAQALEAVELPPERVAASWKRWVNR
jgi:hypothetical protein